MKLQILVGMIASGKSTYCKNAAKEGVICVNDDAIVNMLHADNYGLYSKDLKRLYKSIENHIIGCALMMNKTVLIDRGLNISKRGRQRFISMAKSFDAKVEAIVFPKDEPEIHANRRFNHDNRGLSIGTWLHCARAHSQSWVDPTFAEGFDSVAKITFEDIKAGKVIL